jgi:hypothetical protein
MSAEALRQAIALAKQGKTQEALELFAQIIRADVKNETAWLWYAYLLPTNLERITALEGCLYHNPDCAEAKKRLAALRAETPAKKQEPQKARVKARPAAARPRLHMGSVLVGVGLTVVVAILSCIAVAALLPSSDSRSSRPTATAVLLPPHRINSMHGPPSVWLYIVVDKDLTESEARIIADHYNEEYKSATVINIDFHCDDTYASDETGEFVLDDMYYPHVMYSFHRSRIQTRFYGPNRPIISTMGSACK